MREEFTIKELKFADQMCFIDDFETLIQKHMSREDAEAKLWLWEFVTFQKQYNGSLLQWIFHFSHADLDNYWGVIIDNMIIDLLGDTRGFLD